MEREQGVKTVFLGDIREGAQVEDCFLVARKNLAETKAGKPYLSLTLMDRSGEMEARVWERARELDGVARPGDVVRVRAVATSFQNRIQLKVSALDPVPADMVRMGDFMPASSREPAEMRAELQRWIAGLDDAGLRGLLEKLFSGPLLEEFCLAPAAKKMHHACLHGLLEHTLSVTGLAARVADHYPRLDRDLLLAGALVHDIAKVREFRYQAPPFEYTDRGRLLGHLVLGVEMVRQAASGVDGLPEQRLEELLHLVLSHHGRHEFGAPVLPMTPEAILLHHLDDMDAKMNMMERLQDELDADECWTGYQRSLERFLYLPPRHGEGGRATEPGPSEGDPLPGSAVVPVPDLPDAARSNSAGNEAKQMTIPGIGGGSRD